MLSARPCGLQGVSEEVGMDPNVMWGGLLGAGLAYELWAVLFKIEGHTLSERTRAWFRIHTRTGKAVFVAGWLALTAWFVPHIVNGG